MSGQATTQHAYRVQCALCEDPGAQLRIAYPFRDGENIGRPVVVAFSCVNGTDEDHGSLSESDLLGLLAARHQIQQPA
jgi:hypothetical protein